MEEEEEEEDQMVDEKREIEEGCRNWRRVMQTDTSGWTAASKTSVVDNKPADLFWSGFPPPHVFSLFRNKRVRLVNRNDFNVNQQVIFHLQVKI